MWLDYFLWEGGLSPPKYPPSISAYDTNVIPFHDVQSISPGFVDTEIFDAAKIKHAKLKSSDILSPEEMADMIAFVMSTGPNVLVIIIMFHCGTVTNN